MHCKYFETLPRGRQIDAERTALDRGKTYDQMSKAEQDLFNNKAEFETAVKQLSQNRDRLVKNSADSLVPSTTRSAGTNSLKPKKVLHRRREEPSGILDSKTIGHVDTHT